MKSLFREVAVGIAVFGALTATACAESVTVPKGTEVILVFDQPLDSGHVKAGQPVRLHVRDTVNIDGAPVLNSGTVVNGIVSKVDKRKRYGVNAKMYIALSPVTSMFGEPLTLEAASQGKLVGGKKTDEAAAATAGGAIVAGPIGLVGGYFVVGKPVKIKVGDTLSTDTSMDTVLSRQ